MYVEGYGITGGSIMPFTLTQATNQQAAFNSLLCATTENLPGVSSNSLCELLRIEEYNNVFGTNDLPVTLTGQFTGNSLKGTLADSRTSYPFKAELAGAFPALDGTWSGDVKCSTLTLTLPDFSLEFGFGCFRVPLTEFHKSLIAPQTWTFSPTANRPGSFDITGTGTAGTNAFVVTGTVLVTSKNKLAGFVQADFGDLGVVFWNFTGKVNPTQGTLKLKGYDTHHGVLGKIKAALTRQSSPG